MASILIIDDDQSVGTMLQKLVMRLGHDADAARDLEEGWQVLQRASFDVVLLDVNLPDGSGLDLLPRIKDLEPSPEVIIITGRGDPDGAELAVNSGAWAYIEKPILRNTLELLLSRSLEFHEMKLARSPLKVLDRAGIVGSGRRMQDCLDTVAQAAMTDANVLLTGETGTGKELFALCIHRNSRRANKSFVVVDCSAIPETLVESVLFGHEKGAFTGATTAREGLVRQADGGTLFLDEVGELPLHVQKVFLRVLQEHRFRPIGAKSESRSNFRLIAATNRDLESMVENSGFREDLLFRLRSISVDLPALRERKEDIQELVTHYLGRLAQDYSTEMKGLAAGFFEPLLAYDWPGNVRELFHSLEEAFAAGIQDPMLFPVHVPTRIRAAVARDLVHTTRTGAIEAAALPGELDSPAADSFPTLKDARSVAEQRYLRRLMSHTRWDVHSACKLSGLSRSRLYDLLKAHNISRENDSGA